MAVDLATVAFLFFYRSIFFSGLSLMMVGVFFAVCDRCLAAGYIRGEREGEMAGWLAGWLTGGGGETSSEEARDAIVSDDGKAAGYDSDDEK